jgi:hypothetical protein
MRAMCWGETAVVILPDLLLRVWLPLSRYECSATRGGYGLGTEPSPAEFRLEILTITRAKIH